MERLKVGYNNQQFYTHFKRANLYTIRAYVTKYILIKQDTPLTQDMWAGDDNTFFIRSFCIKQFLFFSRILPLAFTARDNHNQVYMKTVVKINFHWTICTLGTESRVKVTQSQSFAVS